MAELGKFLCSVLLVFSLSLCIASARHTSKRHSGRFQNVLNVPDVPYSTTGYDCSCNVSQIWIDVVFLISTSEYMKQQGFIDTIMYIQDSVENLNIQTNGYSDTPYYTRAGLIAFGDTVETYATLGEYDTDDFIDRLDDVEYTRAAGTKLVGAMQAASHQFDQFQSDNQYRKKMIFIFTSVYNPFGEESPTQIAKQFNATGGIIAVYNLIDDLGLEDKLLVDIASAGYYIDSRKTSLLEPALIFALCDANCFCGPAWRSPSKDYRNKPIGGCYSTTHIQISDVKRAASACKKLGHEGIIAVDKSQNASDFFTNIFDQNSNAVCWIGLEYNSLINNGDYTWSDGSTLSDYHPWINYQVPTPSLTKNCVIRSQNNGITNWIQVPCAKDLQYEYICQLMPCKAGEYCGPLEFT